jgi:hypothetical protein
VTKKEFPTNEVQNRQLLADRSSQFFFSQKIHRRKIKVDVKLWSKKKETSRNIENLCDTRFCPDKNRPKRRASQTLSCITTREKKSPATIGQGTRGYTTLKNSERSPKDF